MTVQQHYARSFGAMRRRTPLVPTKHRNIQIGISVLSVIVGLALWWCSVAFGFVNPILLPSPRDVLQAILEMSEDGSLFVHIGVSLGRALGGFLIAAVVGIPLGILVGRSAGIAAAIDPWIELLRPVPPIAFLPLVVLWFGIGELSKLVIVCYGALFPILINTIHGVRSVENGLVRAARALGANKRQIFYLVVLPAATPSILTGLRLGAGMAIFVLVAAELLGSSSGLGWLITDSREHFFTDRIMVGIIALGLVGYCINRGLIALEKRLLRWRPIQEE